MHIFYPIGSYYPAQSGGPNNSIYWLANALKASGAQVTVVTTSLDQPTETPLNKWLQLDSGQVQYVRTRIPNLPFRLVMVAAKTMRKADVVHLTSFFYPGSILLAVVAVLLKKPIVWSPRGEVDPAALVYSSAVKRYVLKLIRRYRNRFSFHTTCEAETTYLKKELGNDVRVVELPNYMLLPSPLPHADEKYLLYIGRIHPKKAIEHLIEAVSLAQQFNKLSYRLLIAGDVKSTYGNTLIELVRKLGLQTQVLFIGVVTGEAKQQLLANAHALILPSHTENFGNVVIEALAQGTPVIASTGTPWAVLSEEKAGFWVANDPAALAVTLDECLSLPANLYVEYRQQAIWLAQRQFDVTINSHRWLTAYGNLLTSNLRKPLCAE